MAEASHDRESDLMSNGQGDMGLPNKHNAARSGTDRCDYVYGMGGKDRRQTNQQD